MGVDERGNDKCIGRSLGGDETRLIVYLHNYLDVATYRINTKL